MTTDDLFACGMQTQQHSHVPLRSAGHTSTGSGVQTTALACGVGCACIDVEGVIHTLWCTDHPSYCANLCNRPLHRQWHQNIAAGKADTDARGPIFTVVEHSAQGTATIQTCRVSFTAGIVESRRCSGTVQPEHSTSKRPCILVLLQNVSGKFVADKQICGFDTHKNCSTEGLQGALGSLGLRFKDCNARAQ